MKILGRHEHSGITVQWNGGEGGGGKNPIPLDGDSATIRKFGQNDMNRSRNAKSAVEV